MPAKQGRSNSNWVEKRNKNLFIEPNSLNIGINTFGLKSSRSIPNPTTAKYLGRYLHNCMFSTYSHTSTVAVDNQPMPLPHTIATTSVPTPASASVFLLLLPILQLPPTNRRMPLPPPPQWNYFCILFSRGF